MEELKENFELKFSDEFPFNSFCFENGELFNLAIPDAEFGYTHSTSTMSNQSSLKNIAGFSQAEDENVTRRRQLHRMRQQRYRQKKKEEQRSAAGQLELARKELEREEEENRKLMQENWAITSLIDNASLLLQKMKLSSASSIYCIVGIPYKKILEMLENLASVHTFEDSNDELIETVHDSFHAFGARTVIHTASLFLSKGQFGDISIVPITRVCPLLMEWCDHPERRPAIEKKLDIIFHRVVKFFNAIREIWPDVLENAVCPAEDFRRKVKEQYLDHLNHVDLVKATRLSEEQKRKLLLAWREYQHRFCGLGALVSQSIQLLEVDCRGAGGNFTEDRATMTIKREMTALSSFDQGMSLRPRREPSFQALESLHSFQKSERTAFLEMIETTFILTPLQFFRLRLLAICSSENSLSGMYLAMMRM